MNNQWQKRVTVCSFLRHLQFSVKKEIQSISVDVVLEARPWPRGASRPIFMVLAFALALASKVQALALRAVLTIFCYYHRTHGPTTTTKESKIIN